MFVRDEVVRMRGWVDEIESLRSNIDTIDKTRITLATIKMLSVSSFGNKPARPITLKTKVIKEKDHCSKDSMIVSKLSDTTRGITPVQVISVRALFSFRHIPGGKNML